MIRTLLVGELGVEPSCPTSFSRRAPSAAGGKAAADLAEKIVEARPFGSERDLALAEDANGDLVFRGIDSTDLDQTVTKWSDAGREELLARLLNGGQFRSRHFRVHVTGSGCSNRSWRWSNKVVLAERSKVYHVFVDPDRVSSPPAGTEDITAVKAVVLYEKSL